MSRSRGGAQDSLPASRPMCELMSVLPGPQASRSLCGRPYEGHACGEQGCRQCSEVSWGTEAKGREEEEGGTGCHWLGSNELLAFEKLWPWQVALARSHPCGLQAQVTGPLLLSHEQQASICYCPDLQPGPCLSPGGTEAQDRTPGLNPPCPLLSLDIALAPSHICLELSQVTSSPSPWRLLLRTEFCFLFDRKELEWESPELPKDQSESPLPGLSG